MRTSRMLLEFALFLVFSASSSAAPPNQAAVTELEPQSISIGSGSIVLKVNDYDRARSKVVGLAGKHGAAVHEERSEINYSGERHGEIILELDAHSLGLVMEDLRRVGKLYSERVQTSDQTSAYQSLGKRTLLLKQNEGELLAFLHSPRRMRGSDILYIQSRLFDSRVQLASVAQDRSDIARRTQRAMVRVALFEPEPRKSFDWSEWRAGASYRARGSFLFVIRKVVTASYYLLFFAPFWVPALLVVFFGGRKLIRYTRQRACEWLSRIRTLKQGND